MLRVSVRVLACFAFFLTSSVDVVASELFPSSASFTAGGDESDSRMVRIGGEYFFSNLQSVYVSFGKTELAESEDVDGYSVRSGELGWASNPLQDFIFSFFMNGSEVEEEWKRGGIGGTIGYQWNVWTWNLRGVVERITFYDLPALLFENRESEIQSYEVGLDLSYFLSDRWSWRGSYLHKTYSEDPAEYTEDLRVLVIPQSVQSEAAGFTDNQVSVGFAYNEGPWSMGFDFIWQRYIDGDQIAQTLQWAPAYTWQKNWQLGLNISRTTYKFEDDNESLSAVGTSLSLGVTRFF
jgi:hypothetical protein